MRERIGQLLGLPQAIRTDGGPEFTSRAMDRWAYGRGIGLKLITAESQRRTSRPRAKARADSASHNPLLLTALIPQA